MQRNTIRNLIPWLDSPPRGGVATLGGTACSDDNTTPSPSTPRRMYNQGQRLGNPLISEVLLSKRSHATPWIDRAPGRRHVARARDPVLRDRLRQRRRSFRRLRQYPGLGAAARYARWYKPTRIRPPQAGSTGWGLPPLANGWGGRKLQDDVVDLALLALFGDPFGADPEGAQGKEALTTDNVAFDSPGITPTFPYLAGPN